MATRPFLHHGEGLPCALYTWWTARDHVVMLTVGPGVDGTGEGAGEGWGVVVGRALGPGLGMGEGGAEGRGEGRALGSGVGAELATVKVDERIAATATAVTAGPSHPCLASARRGPRPMLWHMVRHMVRHTRRSVLPPPPAAAVVQYRPRRGSYTSNTLVHELVLELVSGVPVSCYFPPPLLLHITDLF